MAACGAALLQLTEACGLSGMPASRAERLAVIFNIVVMVVDVCIIVFTGCAEVRQAMALVLGELTGKTTCDCTECGCLATLAASRACCRVELMHRMHRRFLTRYPSAGTRLEPSSGCLGMSWWLCT